MSVKQRIKEAYLSDKNIESVNELLINELVTLQVKIDILYQLYPIDVLASFLKNMMHYVILQSDGKLNDPNFITDPKKTVVLLNYIAIKKTLLQIIEQYNNYVKTKPPALSRNFPNTNNHNNTGAPPRILPQATQGTPQATLPQKTQPQPQQFATSTPLPNKQPSRQTTMLPVGSISIEELFPKKKKVNKAISLKTLHKSEQFEIHDWWKNPSAMEEEEEGEEEQTEQHQPQDEQQLPQQQIIPPPTSSRIYPWNFINLYSIERNMTEYPSPAHYSAMVKMGNIHSVYLHSIDIEFEHNVVCPQNNTLYYSEDDEEMKQIVLPTMTGDNVQDVIDFCSSLSNQMTENSATYRYDVTLNRHTRRIKFKQYLQSGQGKNKLHLYFEQTRRNCGDILGFGCHRDYRDDSEYEGIHEHRLDNVADQTGAYVHLMIPELSSQPCLTLPICNGMQKYKQEFEGHLLMEHDEGKDVPSIENLTVTFIDSDGKNLNSMKGEHTIVLKYFYVPGGLLATKKTDIIKEHKPVEMHDEITSTTKNHIASTTWVQCSQQETTFFTQPEQPLHQQGAQSEEKSVKSEAKFSPDLTVVPSMPPQTRKKKLPPLDL